LTSIKLFVSAATAPRSNMRTTSTPAPVKHEPFLDDDDSNQAEAAATLVALASGLPMSPSTSPVSAVSSSAAAANHIVQLTPISLAPAGIPGGLGVLSADHSGIGSAKNVSICFFCHFPILTNVWR